MLNIMKCLQDALIPEAAGAVGAVQTCEELNNEAFNFHAPCYLKNGLCALPPSDWEVIVSVVKHYIREVPPQNLKGMGCKAHPHRLHLQW